VRHSLSTLIFERWHRSWAAGSLAAIVLVGLIDYLTGPDITFSVFYLVPVAVAAWAGGTKAAIGASALAAVAWLCAEIGSSRVHPSVFVYTWNFCTRLLYLLLVALLLARLRVMLMRERHASRSDPLTGLFNVRAFRELAAAEIARADRYRQALSLAFVDIDDFKEINDRHGHAAGDRLLACVAEAIRSKLRASDLVARYGGDEFVVLMPMTDGDAAQTAIDKLRRRVADAAIEQGRPVTFSIGVVTCDAAWPSASARAQDDKVRTSVHRAATPPRRRSVRRSDVGHGSRLIPGRCPCA
jgi:diguanylate cyclase (GGDEF)-like protein